MRQNVKSGKVSWMIMGFGMWLIMFSRLYAAAPDTLWTKAFGSSGTDEAFSVSETADGGYIAVGWYQDGNYLYIIKTDRNGDTLWTRTLAGDDGYARGSYVVQTSDGNYVVVGKIYSSATAFSDVWLLKLNQNGDTMWTRTYGGDGFDSGNCVQETSDGGFIITGYIESLVGGVRQSDVCLIKTDSNGDTIWTKSYGGSGSDGGRYVQQTSDGGYIIVGSVDSYGDGYSDIYLIKTDSDGNLEWSKAFGDSASYDDGYCVQQTMDGGYIISGRGAYPLIKTDNSGNLVWSKPYGGSSVRQTLDGGYVVVGSIEDTVNYNIDLALFKLDADGDTLWTASFGGDGQEMGYDVQQTSDGGYIAVGYTNSFGAGDHDVYLIKTASTGIVEKENVLYGAGLLNYAYLPGHGAVEIKYRVPVRGHVDIRLYNPGGQMIRTLVNEIKNSGGHKLILNMKELHKGIYVLRYDIGGSKGGLKLLIE